jgi:hypothetical protein
MRPESQDASNEAAQHTSNVFFVITFKGSSKMRMKQAGMAITTHTHTHTYVTSHVVNMQCIQDMQQDTLSTVDMDRWCACMVLAKSGNDYVR